MGKNHYSREGQIGIGGVENGVGTSVGPGTSWISCGYDSLFRY